MSSIREAIVAAMNKQFSGPGGTVPMRYDQMKNAEPLFTTLLRLEELSNKSASLDEDQARVIGQLLFHAHDDGKWPGPELILPLVAVINTCKAS